MPDTPGGPIDPERVKRYIDLGGTPTHLAIVAPANAWVVQASGPYTIDATTVREIHAARAAYPYLELEGVRYKLAPVGGAAVLVRG